MTIRYIGNFAHPWCTEVHLASTLDKLGHTVIRLQENATNDVIQQCDLFLYTKTWGDTVTLDHLDWFKAQDIPTASVHLDLYHGLERDGGIESSPFWKTQFVFTADGDPKTQKFFEGKGINHFWLPPGVLEDECYIVDVPLSKDIIFVGSYGYHPEYPYRPQLIDWLKNTYGSQFEHWGPQGLGHVRGDDLNRLYASTKVIIGDSLLLPGHTRYWSDRIPESTGRGGFLIHPKVEGLESSYEYGQEIVTYTHGDFKELQAVIDYYLTHDNQREEIRRSGHERTKRDHTYTNRMKEMLDIIDLTRGKK